MYLKLLIINKLRINIWNNTCILDKQYHVFKFLLRYLTFFFSFVNFLKNFAQAPFYIARKKHTYSQFNMFLWVLEVCISWSPPIFSTMCRCAQFLQSDFSTLHILQIEDAIIFRSLGRHLKCKTIINVFFLVSSKSHI